MPDKDKYLVVKGLAGLGNRLLGVLTGILYAKLSGRRLIIDWRDTTFSTDGSNAFHELFLCPMSLPVDDLPMTESVNPDVWRGNLHKSASSMRKPYKNNTEFWRNTSINLTKLDYDEDLLIMWAYHGEIELLRNHFKGRFEEFSHLSKEEILKFILQNDIQPHPTICDQINDFKIDNLNRRTVGVHIRYSDHRAALFSILDKLNKLLKIEPDLMIFLATDNIQIKKMIDDNYSGVISTNHWYPRPGARIHDNRSCPDPLNSGIEALVDLYLLAECDYLIIDSSSTYSYVANLISKADKSNIFDVTKREKLSPRLRRISWRLMLRMGIYSWGLKLVSKINRARQGFNR